MQQYQSCHHTALQHDDKTDTQLDDTTAIMLHEGRKETYCRLHHPGTL